MIQQHGKLLQIHHRLKTMAEEQGDHAFATALGSCIATVRGATAGADTCPFRKLILEDYVKTGVAPTEAITDRQRSTPMLQGNSSAALTHDAVLNRVKTLLQQDARRLDDQRYLQALADCEEATKSNPSVRSFSCGLPRRERNRVPAKPASTFLTAPPRCPPPLLVSHLPSCLSARCLEAWDARSGMSIDL